MYCLLIPCKSLPENTSNSKVCLLQVQELQQFFRISQHDWVVHLTSVVESLLNSTAMYITLLHARVLPNSLICLRFFLMRVNIRS